MSIQAQADVHARKHASAVLRLPNTLATAGDVVDDHVAPAGDDVVAHAEELS
ncbi:hypothetical protein [Pseudonocardia sp.]|jgi:hypothetical protein|uniref:hypothetical protein n=1 Tax=Pseudonocardia sp. TaxID=60912 RepID=UPI0031FD5FA9